MRAVGDASPYELNGGAYLFVGDGVLDVPLPRNDWFPYLQRRDLGRRL